MVGAAAGFRMYETSAYGSPECRRVLSVSSASLPVTLCVSLFERTSSEATADAPLTARTAPRGAWHSARRSRRPRRH